MFDQKIIKTMHTDRGREYKLLLLHFFNEFGLTFSILVHTPINKVENMKGSIDNIENSLPS